LHSLPNQRTVIFSRLTYTLHYIITLKAFSLVRQHFLLEVVLMIFFKTSKVSLLCGKLRSVCRQSLQVSAICNNCYCNTARPNQYTSTRTAYQKGERKSASWKLKRPIWPIHSTRRVLKVVISFSLLILSTNNVTSVLNAKQQWIRGILHILRTQDHTRSYICIL
jgi:hypothetical protein